MIPRYTLPKMSEIWSEENRLGKMLEIEILAVEALAQVGIAPKAAAQKIRRRAKIDIAKIKEIESRTLHDVAAFVDGIAESVGEASRFIHFGLTSQDVTDTALNLLMREAMDVLIADAEKLKGALKAKAHKYRYTPCIGRTHGVHAQPTTFGLKMAVFYAQLTRDIARLKEARAAISVGKISGAVGTYAGISPAVESYICRKLRLAPVGIATQVVQRDRHAQYMAAIAIAGGTLDALATEIRHLHRTEVKEAEEPFLKGQKGSSAMPHKKNPVACERISGLARMLRGYCSVAMEDITLWHERDISHSSCERIIIPDATTLLDYMAHIMTGIVEKLNVYPENMLKNLALTKGTVYSQMVLLKLIEKGLSRQDAYTIIQKDAFEAHCAGQEFKEHLLKDFDVIKILSREEIEECFDIRQHFRCVDVIFKKIGI
jgi:adenylosuccinate lyase